MRKTVNFQKTWRSRNNTDYYQYWFSLSEIFFFLQDAEECLFSHDVELQQVWELCKFYVYDRCVKRDKCLYMHKTFPCKFFHLGLNCRETDESCKFSHDPLNETTRGLLLKVRT